MTKNSSENKSSREKEVSPEKETSGGVGVGRVDENFVEDLQGRDGAKKRAVIRSLSDKERLELRYRLAEKILNIEAQIETAFVRWKKDGKEFDGIWLKKARYASKQTRLILSYVDELNRRQFTKKEEGTASRNQSAPDRRQIKSQEVTEAISVKMYDRLEMRSGPQVEENGKT
jgi:hypothetical protein